MGPATVGVMELLLGLTLGLALGVGVGIALTRMLLRHREELGMAGVVAERDLLQARVERLEAAGEQVTDTRALLTPVQEALGRVERQVGTLERDRVEQFARVDHRLADVVAGTVGLRDQTAALAGALNSSTTRGAWGEVQLRRILEHSGMLGRCDFDEQVRAHTRTGASVRPDVVVRLPGERVLVIDSKAPMTAFLESVDLPDSSERDERVQQHAHQVRAHVDALAAKEYWSAFERSPELVVCFVPTDAMLSAALAADATLLDHAMHRRVVLASPSTLLALLRSVAFAWQQDALADNARELLTLGNELYGRLSTLGGHVTRMGSSLRRSVESYNAMIGALESRVLVTARRFEELELTQDRLPDLVPVEVADRPLTSAELIGSELDALTPQRERLDTGGSLDRGPMESPVVATEPRRDVGPGTARRTG